jgi:hypothetical protein
MLGASFRETLWDFRFLVPGYWLEVNTQLKVLAAGRLDTGFPLSSSKYCDGSRDS